MPILLIRPAPDVPGVKIVLTAAILVITALIVLLNTDAVDSVADLVISAEIDVLNTIALSIAVVLVIDADMD
jgi:hypothetical protein